MPVAHLKDLVDNCFRAEKVHFGRATINAVVFVFYVIAGKEARRVSEWWKTGESQAILARSYVTLQAGGYGKRHSVAISGTTRLPVNTKCPLKSVSGSQKRKETNHPT